MAQPLGTYTIASDQSITVHGNPGDWVGSPYITDPTGDAVSAGLDLKECYVGSDGTDLFVMMNTYGPIDPSAMGQVFMYFDTSTSQFWSALGGGWTVWEGSKALSDIGVGVGDEIYVMFYLSLSEGDVAPNEGYGTNSVPAPVGGEVFAIEPPILLGSYLGLVAASILCVALAMVFYKKLNP